MEQVPLILMIVMPMQHAQTLKGHIHARVMTDTLETEHRVEVGTESVR